jgi:hypothetical protein
MYPFLNENPNKRTLRISKTVLILLLINKLIDYLDPCPNMGHFLLSMLYCKIARLRAV